MYGNVLKWIGTTCLAWKPICGYGRVFRAHRMVVANREKSQVNVIAFPNHFHVVKKARVTCMVYCFAFGGEQNSGRHSRIDNGSGLRVNITGAMESLSQLHFTKVEVDCTSLRKLIVLAESHN